MSRPATGSSPRCILSMTVSNCSSLFSTSSRARRSFSVSALSAASRFSARSPTPAHSRSMFSTMSFACFSLSSMMVTSLFKPETSAVKAASCSASRPCKSCTFVSACVNCCDDAVCADWTALRELSVRACFWVRESCADCNWMNSACLVRR